jgi:hypothetical protein
MVVPLLGPGTCLHVRKAHRSKVEIAWQKVPMPVAIVDVPSRGTFRDTAWGVQINCFLAQASRLRQFLNHSPCLLPRCRPGTPRETTDETKSDEPWSDAYCADQEPYGLMGRSEQKVSICYISVDVVRTRLCSWFDCAFGFNFFYYSRGLLRTIVVC